VIADAMSDSPRTELTVLAVPAFKDNYLWLIHDGTHAAAVDPGDGKAILAALDARQLTLTAILLTHHHADHIGGVPELLAHAKVPVFGPRSRAMPMVSRVVAEGDRIAVPGLALDLEVLEVPGHTQDHIAYLRHAPGSHWLFCGDTLFAGGCGRLFDGTAQQLMQSLSRLAGLPGNTLVFCAHEYTLANLRFAQAVEPDNEALQLRLRVESEKRSVGLPTVPSTIDIENATNPFLRFQQPAIVASLMAVGKLDAGATPLDTFAALRAWKNVF
jgi:hydroxyacylglutathione hydrolase